MRIQIQTLIKRTVTEALNKRGQSALLAESSASKVGRKKTFPYIRENVAYFFQGESSQVATTISIRFHVFFTHITYLAILFREPHYLFVSLISGSLSPESRLGFLQTRYGSVFSAVPLPPLPSSMPVPLEDPVAHLPTNHKMPEFETTWIHNLWGARN